MARKNRDFYDSDEESITPEVTCWLCSRPMGEVTEWHHPVPKARGGRERQAVHPICHRTIHANFIVNADGTATAADIETLITTVQQRVAAATGVQLIREVRIVGDAALLAALGHDPVGLDALQARTGWPTAQLQAALLELELVGEVGRLPGGLFQRVGRV